MNKKIQDIANWIDALKISLLENNIDNALNLSQNLPDFNSIDDLAVRIEFLNMAKELISQIIEKMSTDKKECKQQMEKIKQVKKFFL